MKLVSFLFVGLSLMGSLAAAGTIKINQLSCSGLGFGAGYTTINLTGSNMVTISSLKFFITTTDNKVKITSAGIAANGQVKLDLYSPLFKSNFSLILSAPVGPAQLVTGAGTDVINCQSNIEANVVL